MMCRAYDCAERLVPGAAGDLDRQKRLIRRLLISRPVYDGTAVRDWPGAVEDALGVPVVLTSHGPTAEDKRERHATRRMMQVWPVGSPWWAVRVHPARAQTAAAPAITRSSL
jgi:hypothetical protein